MHTTPHAQPQPSARRPEEALAVALTSPDSSARLQAAMTAGSRPRAEYVEVLVARSGVEPDFSIRETLTWALTQHPVDDVLPRVLEELRSAVPRAVAQALHTVSKLGDERAWPAITHAHLHSPDDEIARTAWRAAAAVAPESAHHALAVELARELGRGDVDTMRSLSRALATLGEAAAGPVAAAAALRGGDVGVASHAGATERLIADPDAAFAFDPADAARFARAFSATSGN
ncbi:HEAT repeat domain-containing protein [Leucobacter sp. NPDC015123]|uniref:HEAT repeat domain-containing protein n=1 Tax=Leucobacter sp. NPDC015123 TaxID=3364129 RepID=UPI0036F4540A